MKTLLTAFTLALALAVTGIRVDAQSGYDLFQKALATERADGDLREAIRLYQRVVDGAKDDRGLAARALVRMAECHRKLGDGDARRLYERVLREYFDQSTEVDVARAGLAAVPLTEQPSRSVMSSFTTPEWPGATASCWTMAGLP
jgi:tetratricopeptide (TPR) repeat protein